MRDGRNPTPGKIINHPLGPDVYSGVPKDYTGEVSHTDRLMRGKESWAGLEDVNPETFLKVLQGDSEGLRGVGSGKVINSGPKDHVFVNFVDHGAPGLVAFPSSEALSHLPCPLIRNSNPAPWVCSADCQGAP